MSKSTAQAKISSKELGNGVEADVIQSFDVEYVTDTEATWYDARAVAPIWPDSPRRLLFGGICVVPAGTQVEIKGALVATSNGDRDVPGRWFFQQRCHFKLLDVGGVYLLVVYQQREGQRQLARIVVPAQTIDDLLRGSWYDAPAARSEGKVAKLSWTQLIDDDQLVEGGIA